MDTFHDLSTLITLDQRQRIKLLYMSSNQLKDMPNTEWSLRNRMHETHELEQELQDQDRGYQRVAPSASNT